MMKFFKKTMVAIVTMGLALSLASPFVASAECDEGCDFSQGITCSGCGVECRHESIDEETKTCDNCWNYGYCGNNLIWVIENDTLTISGSGAMTDFVGSTPLWYQCYDDESLYAYRTVVIENGVTSIGAYAFGSCEGVSSVTIPNTVTSIGENAFDGTKIEEINIPNSVKRIGDFAFSCTSLSEVYIPDSVTTIGYEVFNECESLTSVSVPCTLDMTDNEFVEELIELRHKGSLSYGMVVCPECCKGHRYECGVCTDCATVCEHNWKNGTCTVCDMVCEHSWWDGVCSTCGAVCGHSWSGNSCTVCGKECEHDWQDGVCSDCNTICAMTDWENGVCTDCGMECPHDSWENGECGLCGTICEIHGFDENGRCTVCGAEDDMGELAGHSLSLGGNIGVNFHMILGEAVANSDTAKMVFTIEGGSTKEVLVSTAEKDEEGRYVFTCEVAASEMEATITARLVEGKQEGTAYSYTVKDYADYILENSEEEAEHYNPEYAKAAEMVQTMLDYGVYAEAYFEDDVDAPENSNIATAFDTVAEEKKDLMNYKPVVNGSNTAFTYAGSSLILESEIKVRHYFKQTGDFIDYGLNPYEAPDGETLEGTYYYYESDGIAAADYGRMTTYDGVTGFSISYCPLSYVTTVVANNATDLTADTELQNLMKALYLYYQAADAYNPN